MTIEDQIKDEKLQYDINREAAKISALSSSKIDKYEYLTGEEILPSNQQFKIINSSLILIMMIIKINCYFQKKEKSLKIFTIKDLIK